MINDENGENWLQELSTGIEKLCFQGLKYDLKDLEFVAKNCKHLISVKIDAKYDYIDLVGFFSYAVNLVEFAGGKFINQHKDEYKSFMFPESVKQLSISCTIDAKFILPFAHLITKLYCSSVYKASDFQLIKSCRNLKVLHLPNDIKDQELQDITIYCKNLRTLIVISPKVSHNGVIHIAKHCVELECLHIGAINMTNRVMRFIGKNMRKLKDFELYLWQKKNVPALDNGVRSLLIRCDKLEMLSIFSQLDGGWLTDKGLGFIGKYGCNLRYLFLGNINVKESDAGVMELSKLGYRCVCLHDYNNKEAINIYDRRI
ncbi:coronatine-insensitive protein 1-like [Rutidosis leptorrhynchoides]|uniref:coronatine-insensitive protein 1-like n=1 Tax=Rutidosis leptorrhynchoides TaxID=125765 RepID=UPI003A9985A4